MTPSAHVTVRRIVVAHDGSPAACGAFETAVDLADHRGADLLVLSVDDDRGTPQERLRLDPRAEATVREAVGSARARLGEGRVAVALLAGEPSDVVLHALRAGDIAVVGSHPRREAVRVWLGSVSRRVATQAHVPVVVVRLGARGAGDRVLVGVDGSQASVEAARFAACEAARTGVPLRAVLAVSLTVGLTGTLSSPDDQALADAAVVLEESLVAARADHPGLEVICEVAQGCATDALLERARHARLLVVGSHGRGAVRAALLGSVGLDVIEHAPCPVVLTR